MKATQRRHWKTTISACIVLLACSLGLPRCVGAGEAALDSTSAGDLTTAARELMEAARYCALTTLDETGQPQVRTMDPFAPDADMVVWFGTLRGSRKVRQISHDSRVALHYMAPGGTGYVSIEGTARIVDDPGEKERRWKEEWEEFYPDRDSDYVLIAVTPKTLRVLDLTTGIMADTETWVVPSVEFGSGNVRP